MPEHLQFGEHLTSAPFDNPIKNTFLGQAHIAGTGPEGTTCRECVHWHKVRRFRDRADGVVREEIAPVEYFGPKHGASPCELKKQYCMRPILNKAKRLIPHHALSCRPFEASENPPQAKRVPRQ